VLATVASKPARGRVVLDAGVKALTAFTRPPGGICATPGHGVIQDLLPDIVRIGKLYDEHGIINDEGAWRKLAPGDRVRVIPNHICPTCNLYDVMHIMENGECVDVYPILCRGRSQ
jgi:D-serine deaminase-like pyridoxal phosphate-dependent protein